MKRLKREITFKPSLKGMAEGVLVVDERGRILMANHALRQLLPSPRIVDRTPWRSSEMQNWRKRSETSSRKGIVPHLN